MVINRVCISICLFIIFIAACGCSFPENDAEDGILLATATNVKYKFHDEIENQKLIGYVYDYCQLTEEILEILTKNDAWGNNNLVKAEDAVKVADIILTSRFGADYNDGLPLSVLDDLKYNMWIIKNSPSPNQLGGTYGVIIHKTDWEIIAVFVTK